jgi:hypothetical protein
MGHDMNEQNERLNYFGIATAEDIAKINALAQLKMKVTDGANQPYHIPDPFFFEPMLTPVWQKADTSRLRDQQCVRGFWGTAPLMLVGSRPTKGGKKNSWQLKLLYQLLLKHGLTKVHITDAIKSIPPSKFDLDVERRVFHEELAIIEPHTVVFFDSEAKDRYAEYLSVPRPKPHPPLALREKFDTHYSQLRFPYEAGPWEKNLIDIFGRIRERLASD